MQQVGGKHRSGTSFSGSRSAQGFCRFGGPQAAR